jgi:DNA-binding SARP family transcriptional activator
LGDAPLRIYLAGRIRLERADTLLDEASLPGRQGRVVFAVLAAEHARAVSRGELAEELWGDEVPNAWDVALRAVVSKVRRVLGGVGLDGAEAIAHAVGCYQLRLPPDAWVDLEAGADAVHRAETALRAQDPSDAMGWALAANAIARRGFLPGEDGPFARRRRTELQDIRVRALECRARVTLDQGDHAAAIRDAELVVGLEPFRETAHRLLMSGHVAAGNRAEALRAYERCRATIAEELGAGPSPETEALYLEILRSA